MASEWTLFSFTHAGEKLAQTLQQAIGADKATIYAFGSKVENPTVASLQETTEEAFRRSDTLLFIGAAGIAVRAIAPYVQDKQTDPAVLVLDEEGAFVIPLLSGHLGGANEKAEEIAALLGATPVLTTATDRRGAFAVDLFAREQRLGIRNKEGIAAVSAKALEGRPITLSIQHFPPEEPVDVLVTDACPVLPESSLLQKGTIVLTTRRAVLGIGCRKGKAREELQTFAEEVLAQVGLEPADLAAIASIQNKVEEEGIRTLARHWHIPFLTFDATLLAKSRGSVSASSFVEETVGVDTVCERAALLAAGAGAELLLPKQTRQGMTMAIAARRTDG